MEKYLDKFVDWSSDKLIDIGLALLFIVIGLRVAKFLLKLIRKSFDKGNTDPSVSGFLCSLIKWVLYTLVMITAASIMGFQVTSFVALLGTTGLTVGLALQGSLANFAGGVLILVMKPFRVGDYIIENDKGCEGTVMSIDIFYTKLRTLDHRIIVIPNGNITNHSLVNTSADTDRMLEVRVSVAYDTDPEEVRRVLTQIIDACPYTQKQEENEIFLEGFGESGVSFCARAVIVPGYYVKARADVNERIFTGFRDAGIKIPYPQVDVHLAEPV